MRKSRTFAPKDAVYPFKGLNTLDPSTLTDPRFSPDCNNVFSDKGIITKRVGYIPLGETLKEPILALPTYESETGALLTAFAITRTHQYRYDATTGGWLECYNAIIDDGSSTESWNANANVDLSVVSGAIKINVAEGFTTGELCYTDDFSPAKDLSGGNSISIRVTPSINIASGAIIMKLYDTGSKGGTPLTVNLPALTAGAENIVHVDQAGLSNTTYAISFETTLDLAAFYLLVNSIGSVIKWTGEDDSWIDYIEGMDANGHYLFLTNNFDQVIYWDGSIMQYYVPTSGLDSFITCRTLATYLGSLVLGNLVITDIDTRYPNTVAYSAPGDFFDYSSTSADLVLLDSTKGGIERILLLGEVLVIYSVNSIGIARFVEGANRYNFDQIILGETRLMSGRGVIGLGPYHALVMQDNIYLFNGTKALVPIAMNIQRLYESSLEVQQLSNAFAFNDTFRKRAYFILPITGPDPDIYKVKMFVLNYVDFTLKQENLTWSVQEFSNIPTCFGYFSEDKSLTWEMMTETWNQASISALTWRDCSVSPGFPFMVMGDATRVFVLDGRSITDNSIEVDGWWDSIDFTVPEHYQSMNGRWCELEIEIAGIDASVYYSTNKGLSWTLFPSGNLTLGQERSIHKLFFDTVSRSLRIRVRSNSLFTLFWYRLWLSPGGI